MFFCCAPEPETVWSSPHETDFLRDDLLDDSKTDNDTATETTDYKALDSGVDSDIAPTWMADKESEVCLQCDKFFSTTNRRTHW